MLTPQWLLYQGNIWKDVLFADAAIAGFAAPGGWRPHAASLADPLLLLLTLAALTRQNGVLLLPVAAVTLG